MKATVISKEKDVFEVKVEGLDEGLARFIATKLEGKRGVRFASANVDHPLTANAVFKVKAASPKEALLDAVKEAEEEIAAASKAFDKLK